MKINEYYFKPDFIEMLLKQIDIKSMRPIYNLNSQAKYSIDYIVDIIMNISTKSYTRYRLSPELCQFLGPNFSQYGKYSKTAIKQIVKEQIFDNSSNNTIFNTYVIIGHDIPINIKELNVVFNYPKDDPIIV
jgi:hypothetical protein